MEKDSRGTKDDNKNTEQVKSPFKAETPPGNEEENPEDEAQLEQQRKDALTERD